MDGALAQDSGSPSQMRYFWPVQTGACGAQVWLQTGEELAHRDLGGDLGGDLSGDQNVNKEPRSIVLRPRTSRNPHPNVHRSLHLLRSPPITYQIRCKSYGRLPVV